RRGTARRAAAAPAVPAPRWTTPRGAPALAADLGAILSRREDGQWGAIVVSLSRGDTLFARDADAPVVPASTMKMYTAALALDRLGPDWRFHTQVLRDGPLGADGTVKGNLVLRGDGDPAFSRRFQPGNDYAAPVLALAEKVAAAGVRRVTGDLVADASAFEARVIPDGWPARNLGSGYSAPFSALSINENIVVVAVHPDGRVLLEPATTAIRVESSVTTRPGRGQGVRVHRAADGHVVARGWIGRAAPVRRLQLVVQDPVTFTAGALHAALAARGVAVDGQVRVGRAPDGAEPVAALDSPPLADLVAVMNRESINHFAELILRNAVRGRERQGEGSAAAANTMLQRFLADHAQVASGAVQVTDGSGLSTLDRVTARSMVQLLAFAHRAPWGSVFHASLPVAGESETLRGRMRGTPAQGNLHAKTGTTNDVISLGGYVTAENGEVLAFSFVFNGRDRWNARATIDAMGATLAGFSREPAPPVRAAVAQQQR
ncbi:D-alanyl-D-alanine carboxypeptidase/D-alanyl-D-alanine-endopeptidase, partial [Roseisolibacter sp. H3M3-2]|uniref:D-alanyl-D-alanine carboxypeptidase/D-alanyl-D-alanine endopeptidase n=1 Tax=Roseisolibacter sp. H3M3-2 TaxID=3031323 RepID=UPI0023DC7251